MRKADQSRQEQIMRERGIPIPKKNPFLAGMSDAGDGSFFKHPHWMRPYPEIARRSGERPDEGPRTEPVQLTLFCDQCFGAGCGDKAVRIDADHYCVDGVKMRRSETWVMKHMTLVGSGEGVVKNFLPKLMMLHKEFNLDIENAEVRQYQAP